MQSNVSKKLSQAEVSRGYQVSRTSVSNWVKDALSGNNDLQLVFDQEKYYILDSDYNHSTLKMLKDRSVKYRNHKNYEKIKVNPEISNYLNRNELIELVEFLENRYIPEKLSYFGEAAKIWNQYILERDKTEPYGYEGKLALENNLENIKDFLGSHKIINIFEIGPANGVISGRLIEFLQQSGFKVTYTYVERSQEMYKLLELNLHNRFPDLEINWINGDIDHINLQTDCFYKKAQAPKDSINLLLFLDYLLGNYFNRNRILTNLRDSLTQDDLLLVSTAMWSKKEIDFLEGYFNNDLSAQRILYFPKLMGLREDIFELNIKYRDNPEIVIRTLKLKKDLSLVFNFGGLNKEIDFFEGEEIVIWMSRSYKEAELLEELSRNFLKIGFYVLDADNTESLVLCKAKFDRFWD